MSVSSVHFINPQWTGPMAPYTLTFKIRAEVDNDYAGDGLNTVYGTTQGTTIVRVTVVKDVNGTETPLANGTKVLTYNAAQQYHESPTISTLQSETPGGTLLKAYIDIDWVLTYSEDNAGCTDYAVPNPPAAVA